MISELRVLLLGFGLEVDFEVLGNNMLTQRLRERFQHYSLHGRIDKGRDIPNISGPRVFVRHSATGETGLQDINRIK